METKKCSELQQSSVIGKPLNLAPAMSHGIVGRQHSTHFGNTVSPVGSLVRWSFSLSLRSQVADAAGQKIRQMILSLLCHPKKIKGATRGAFVFNLRRNSSSRVLSHQRSNDYNSSSRAQICRTEVPRTGIIVASVLYQNWNTS